MSSLKPAQVSPFDPITMHSPSPRPPRSASIYASLVVLVLICVLDLYCFHIEALSSEDEIEKLIQHIKAKNMKVGIAIKPKTPSSVLYPWISSIDMALVMVHPSPLSASYTPRFPAFGSQSYLRVSPDLNSSASDSYNSYIDVVTDSRAGIRRPKMHHILLFQSPRFAHPISRSRHRSRWWNRTKYHSGCC
jgi:hypothetical protein